ncbi:MAG TPA: RNA 2',3'-cyclic phosphodiesterase [Vicinamibacterales bacterium]|nr:RNA 2',3'-cyclic phosphodiesterase [Acidobacteriota bacterium]HOC17228.1 RNA 2',3'-cyclic phosphodiesterase [Vicinamibacterales bacterium]
MDESRGPRLFFAVELDEAVRRAAARVAAELSRALAADGRAEVSWVRAENMHLTVRFLGETPAPRVAPLVEAFAVPLATPPFELRFAGLGTFPPSGPARVIWLGIVAGHDQLAAVHREVEDRLGPLGVEREERPYRAHLTLGRVRGRLGPRAASIVGGTVAAGVPASAAREVTLFESRLSPRGAIYTALCRTALGTARKEGR